MPDPLIEILQKDVNWPSYKAGKDNDFNYMIETLGVMHTSLEKMKGFIQPVAGKGSVENEKQLSAVESFFNLYKFKRGAILPITV